MNLRKLGWGGDLDLKHLVGMVGVRGFKHEYELEALAV
jgi:hypothetical protein